jgi:hypothetical protein
MARVTYLSLFLIVYDDLSDLTFKFFSAEHMLSHPYSSNLGIPMNVRGAFDQEGPYSSLVHKTKDCHFLYCMYLYGKGYLSFSFSDSV